MPIYTGTELADYINGSHGVDIISGLGGNDGLTGEAGNDTLNGGPGNDTIDGNGNIDTAVYTGRMSDFAFHYTPPEMHDGGGATLFPFIVEDKTGTNGTDTLDNVEILSFDNGNLYWNGHGYGSTPRFTEGNDNVSSTADGDFIEAFAGNDYIRGNDGDDMIRGGLGDDKLDGGNGEDWLDGGAGNDRLIGGDGDDILITGEGVDTVRGGNGNDFADFYNSSSGYAFGEAGNDEMICAINGTFSGDEGDDILAAALEDSNIKMIGGAGSDLFYFSYAFTGLCQINDFEQSIDHIRFDLSFASFDEVEEHLTSNSQGNAVILTDNGGKITLIGVDPAVLTADDFIFG